MGYFNKFIFLFCLGVILAFLIPYNIPLSRVSILIILLFIISFYVDQAKYLLFFLIGISYTLYSFHVNKKPNIQYNDSYKNIKILVLSGIKDNKFSKKFYAKIIDKNKLLINKIILNDYLKRNWNIGQVWEVDLKLKPIIGMVNNIGFNKENWSLANSIDAYGNLGKHRKLVPYEPSYIEKITINWQKLRDKTKNRIYKIANNHVDGAGLVCALILGDTSSISGDNIKIFKKLGLIHLISISGLHIGIIAYFIYLVLFSLFKILVYLKINLVPNNLRLYIVILSCIGAFIYSLFAGFSISAQRSIFMLVVLSIVIVNKSYTNMWTIWLLSLFSVLVCNPMSVLLQGFWLSFLFTAILIFSTYGFLNKQDNFKIINFFRAQFAVTLVTIVLIGFFFSNLPILSPFVNLIAIPWFSVILTPFVLISIIFPWDFLLNIVILLSQMTLKILSFFSLYSYYFSISKIPLIFLFLVIIAVLFLILPIGIELKIWAISIIVCFLFFPQDKIKNGNVKVNIFDLDNNGLSLLIQTSNHNILYDTGKSMVADNIISNLNYLGVKSLDMIILSNNNSFNDGGFDIINNYFKVEKIFAGQPYRYIQNNILHCKNKLKWSWDNIYFEFLTPSTFLKTKKNNDASCVLKVITQEKSLIITGSLGIKGQYDLVKKYSNSLYSNILILGVNIINKRFLMDNFLDYIHPEYIILSLGINNIYNLPMENSIFRTDLHGQIEVNMGKDSIRVNKISNFKKFWQIKPFNN